MEILNYGLTSQDLQFLACQLISTKQHLASPAKEETFYSDSNHQLPGERIEPITDKSFNTMVKLIQKVVKKKNTDNHTT